MYDSESQSTPYSKPPKTPAPVEEPPSSFAGASSVCDGVPVDDADRGDCDRRVERLAPNAATSVGAATDAAAACGGAK